MDGGHPRFAACRLSIAFASRSGARRAARRVGGSPSPSAGLSRRRRRPPKVTLAGRGRSRHPVGTGGRPARALEPAATVSTSFSHRATGYEDPPDWPHLALYCAITGREPGKIAAADPKQAAAPETSPDHHARCHSSGGQRWTFRAPPTSRTLRPPPLSPSRPMPASPWVRIGFCDMSAQAGWVRCGSQNRPTRCAARSR